jgi:hypothetical protein
MGDFKSAAHASQSADVALEIDTNLFVEKLNPHHAWEKLAVLYERTGNWDMALHWRLKQLAGITNEQDRKKKTEPLTEKIIYLLARIGAAEPIETLLPPKYDIEKLRRISQIYLAAGVPDEAGKVVLLMESVAQKQLTAERAVVYARKAEILFRATETRRSENFWPVLWEQVWTYDKVVAVHKQAIEWGKKAGWDEARLKNLEDQITQLPDLLKYVKEPKNVPASSTAKPPNQSGDDGLHIFLTIYSKLEEQAGSLSCLLMPRSQTSLLFALSRRICCG